MATTNGILLNDDYENNLTIGGELAWFIREQNTSTGYIWQFVPDNSGVYEEVETIVLRASVSGKGVPGTAIWKFKAVKRGTGSMIFQSIRPGSGKPSEEIKISVSVT
jgi:predicted secreted protein